MIFIPAIDLKDGNCVRLTQGEFNKCKVYGNDPIYIMEKYEFNKADWIHVVDLDGALKGKTENLKTIEKIVKNTNCCVQLGGGIRNIKSVELYLSYGVNRIILGTSVVKNFLFVKDACNKFYGKIAVSIDMKNGFVLTDGWSKTSSISYREILQKLEDIGVSVIIWTDVVKDGMLEGVNISEISMIIKDYNIPFILSGGVSCINDLKKINDNFKYKLAGIISGKAIYENLIKIDTAIKLFKN